MKISVWRKPSTRLYALPAAFLIAFSSPAMATVEIISKNGHTQIGINHGTTHIEIHQYGPNSPVEVLDLNAGTVSSLWGWLLGLL